jgi:hypothetical protein
MPIVAEVVSKAHPVNTAPISATAPDKGNGIPHGTPTKLKSGAWGARVEGPIMAGEVILVVTRSGKSWPALVTRIVWQGEGVSVVETASLDRAPRAPRSR